MDHTPYTSRDLDQTRAMLGKYQQQAECYADHHPRLAEAVDWVFAEAKGLLAEIDRLRAAADEAASHRGFAGVVRTIAEHGDMSEATRQELANAIQELDADLDG